MDRFGLDASDMRFGTELIDHPDVMGDVEFELFMQTVESSRIQYWIGIWNWKRVF